MTVTAVRESAARLKSKCDAELARLAIAPVPLRSTLLVELIDQLIAVVPRSLVANGDVVRFYEVVADQYAAVETSIKRE
jgi:hypothetical protein